MFACKKMRCIIALLFLKLIAANEYCKLCKKGTHTLCKYKEGPSDACVEYKRPEFPSSVRRYIVDVHNDIRNHIASGQETRGALGKQPAAANMQSLQWDTELAEIAQRWADQCIGLDSNMQHDLCRKTGRFDVGQNVLTAVTPTPTAPELGILILNWYKQVENVLPSDVDNFSGYHRSGLSATTEREISIQNVVQRGKLMIGQYTQMVWADTLFLGCGLASFRNRNTNDTNAKYLHRLVCNYGPRGNIIGSPIYDRGPPCSKCPYGRCDPTRTNLCQVASDGRNESDFGFANLTHVARQNSGKNLDDILQSMPKNDLYVSTDEIASLTVKSIDSSRQKTVDILHTDDQTVFELSEGCVVVEDCKRNPQFCQLDGDEVSDKRVRSNDVVLPNGMIYRKTEGIWFHGRCRFVRDPNIFKWLEIFGEPITYQRRYDGDRCFCLYRIE